MNEKYLKTVGIVLSVFSLAMTLFFISGVTFNPNPQVWFTPAYYLQFIPLYLAATLLLCGIFITTGFNSINLYLAVFGHATSEEIIFSAVGITTTPLPLFASLLFFPLSLLALWVAYANTLNKKKLSIAEAIFGIVFSTAFILLPRFL